MKVAIIVDLEGASGLSDDNPNVVRCHTIEWEQHGKYAITKDLMKIVGYLDSLGISEISIFDIHDKGNSILKSEIKFSGVISWYQMMHSLLFDFSDYCFSIMVGFHGKEDACGFFPHTFRSDIKDLRINGKSIGEVETYIEYMEVMGSPVKLVVGDNACSIEALATGRDIRTIVVKSKDNGYQSYLSDNNFEKEIESTLNQIISTNKFLTAPRREKIDVEVSLKLMEYLNSLKTRQEDMDFEICEDIVKKSFQDMFQFYVWLNQFFKILSEESKLLKKKNREFLDSKCDLKVKEVVLSKITELLTEKKIELVCGNISFFLLEKIVAELDV